MMWVVIDVEVFEVVMLVCFRFDGNVDVIWFVQQLNFYMWFFNNVFFYVNYNLYNFVFSFLCFIMCGLLMVINNF